MSSNIKSNNKVVMWDILNKKGKLMGPYSTEAVLRMINQGALLGDEQVRQSPNGKWIPLSTKADFYDALINSLNTTSSSLEAAEPPTKVTGDESVSVFENEKSGDSVSSSSAQEVSISKVEHHSSKAPLVSLPLSSDDAQNLSKNTFTQISPSAEVAREKVSDQQKDQRQRQNAELQKIIAAVIITIALATMVVALFWPDDVKLGRQSYIQLVGPQLPGKALLKPEQVKEIMTKAIDLFTQDTIESYEKSQSLLVSLVEGTERNFDALGTLCVVYKELWPFTQQSAKDQKLVMGVTQSARNQDPIGINGAYCDAVRLLIMGKYKEAKGVIEHSLEDRKFSTAPILYSMKAELLAQENDYRTAALYAQKAAELWPGWIKPLVDSGVFFAKTGERSQSVSALLSAINTNPSHRRAQLEYGIMLAEVFQKEEEALKTLNSSISMSGLVPILTEAAANYYLAVIWARRKNLDKAVRFAKKAFELNPAERTYKKLLTELGSEVDEKNESSQNDLIFLGDQFFRSGNCLAAQAQYKTAFERDPTNGVAAFKAAKCLWVLSQTQEAVSWLNYAIKADPRLTQAYALQADYLSAQYDYTRAIQVLNKAARMFPNNSEVLKGFGLVELRRNNVPSAIGFLQRSLKVFSTDTETLTLLAKAHGANNEFLQAQRYAVRALELDSTNQEAHIVYAKILTQFQGLESGVVYLKDLISRFSYTIEFRMALGELFKEQQKYIEAQNIFSQVLQVEPKNKKALLGLGESLQSQGLRDKALSYYLSATLIDPADPEGLIRAGLLHLEAGAYKSATEQFQRAGKVNPLYPKLNFYIGQTAFQAGDLNLALQATKQEKKNNPNLSDPYILAAQIYTEQKQYQKCAEEYQQVIKMRPQGAKTYVNLAKCYRLMGSLDVAEAMINIAATKESGNPEIYKEQGAIFEAKSYVRAAVASYNKYLALSPNAPDKAQIEAKITALGRQ